MSAFGTSGLFDLTGQVALVTGASSGLGLAVSEAMAAHGAAVAVAGIDGAGCEAAVQSLRERGCDAVAFACDLGLRDASLALAEAVLRRFGRVDSLVCNAGVQGPAGALGEVSESDWDRVMSVNLRSAWWLTSALVPGMAARGGGSVILMASIAALRGNRAIGLYGMSKAALAQLARNLAVEWGPRGVRANAIAPGLIRTPLAKALMSNEAFMARRLALTPMRRVGEPHEIAGVAVMLASRAGGFITGQTLVVDGGTLIGDGNPADPETLEA